jgi:hypothetical protein
MTRVTFLLTIVAAWLAAARTQATSAQLALTVSNPVLTTGTWTVTATLSDNQTLGIAAFSADVLGSSNQFGGLTVGQAADPAQTLKVSNPPYSVFRSNGVLSPPSLIQINASQDIVTAAQNRDPSILRFGDGLLSNAASPVYGTVAPSGPLILASGTWSVTGPGGTIQAVLTPGAFFNLFPLNYAVDDGSEAFNPPPPGAVQHTVAAAAVLASQKIFVGLPEPASLVLMVLGGFGLVSCVPCRAWRRSSPDAHK